MISKRYHLLCKTAVFIVWFINTLIIFDFSQQISNYLSLIFYFSYLANSQTGSEDDDPEDYDYQPENEEDWKKVNLLSFSQFIKIF